MRLHHCCSRVLAVILIYSTMTACGEADRATNGPKQVLNKTIEARQELARMHEWLVNPVIAASPVAVVPAFRSVGQKLRTALKDPRPEIVSQLRREVLAVLSSLHGGDGTFALGIAQSLDKVFLDGPFQGKFAKALNVSLAQNESEGAQLVILSAGKELKTISVRLDGLLVHTTRRKEFIPNNRIEINLIGYVDTTTGDRPYQSSKLGWWPDPLLPNRTFDVAADEKQSLLVTVTTTDKTVPGVYTGKLIISTNGVETASIPLEVAVYNFALHQHGQFATFALGCESSRVAEFYGGDPGGKIMERYVKEACRHRMPPVGLINGWGWKTSKTAKKPDGSYDFSLLDRWLDLFKSIGVTRFPMAIVPRFRKFGGGEYTSEFKLEFGAFVKAYSYHLKEKGLYDAAVLYNIDEASNDPKLREWEVCKELYHIVKQAAPDLPVVQCLNENKSVQALAGYADIWDLYFGQYEQSGGPERLMAGDQVMLTACIWPSGHPNLFIEYPLLDARVMPWIAFRVGAKGFEYWDMFASWKENHDNREWWKTSTRTAWKLRKPHGDGLLMYPGPAGTPLSSLRLEALRDGIEDYEYLALLSEHAKKNSAAAALLMEARESLVTGATSYNSDPAKLLDLRRRIALLLERH